MHTNRKVHAVWRRLSCRISKGAYSDCAVTASQIGSFYSKYVDCMEVYEPIIALFEKGGNFLYRERGMSFICAGLIPVANWFEDFN